MIVTTETFHIYAQPRLSRTASRKIIAMKRVRERERSELGGFDNGFREIVEKTWIERNCVVHIEIWVFKWDFLESRTRSERTLVFESLTYGV